MKRKSIKITPIKKKTLCILTSLKGRWFDQDKYSSWLPDMLTMIKRTLLAKVNISKIIYYKKYTKHNYPHNNIQIKHRQHKIELNTKVPL